MPRISAEEDEEFADFEARVADVGKCYDAPLRPRAPCAGHVRDAPPSSVRHVHTLPRVCATRVRSLLPELNFF